MILPGGRRDFHMFTIPNLLTTLRILLVAPTIWLLNEELYFAALAVGTIALITDFFDGMLARKLNQQSYVGAILDPVADKIAVIAFFGFFYVNGQTPLWYFLLIFIRDVAQLLAIPVLLWWKKIQFKVEPALIAKWGTALNFIILGAIWIKIVVLKYLPEWAFYGDYILWPLYIVSGIIEVYVLVTYVPRFFQILRGKHDTFN